MEMIRQKIKSLIYAGIGLVLCVLLCGEMSMTAQAAEMTDDDFWYEESEDGGMTITGYTGDETDLVIPGEINGKEVTSIGDFAFEKCYSLTSIEIPAGVTSIGESAFKYCNGLTSITVDSKNKYYDSRDNCNAIIETGSNTLIRGCKSSKIPAGVTSIGNRAFEECYGLTSIEISAGVTSIGESAFEYCYSLTSIEIPAGVTSIGESAFKYCNGLTSITVDSKNKYYDSRDNCNAIIETGSNTLIRGCKSSKIPAGVTSIGNRAFYNCNGLTSIEIPAGVTSIGESAFWDCSGLTSIKIPSGVTSIEKYAFYECYGLTSIEIPAGVTSIGHDAFGACPDLVIACYKDSYAYNYAIDNNIPVKLLEVETSGDASGDDKPTPNPTTPSNPKKDDTQQKPKAVPAKKGTTLTVSSKKLKVKVTSSSKKNPTVTVTKITDKKAKKLTIPASVKVKGVTYKVTGIADKAFKNNKKLTTVTIGNNVTKIGKEAFSGCSALKKVTIGKNVTSIGNKAFYKCTKLASVTIPAKVTTIGNSAFSGCKKLKTITVTAGKLQKINKNAFKGIKKNAAITVKGKKQAKTALKKKLKKSSIGYVKTWKLK